MIIYLKTGVYEVPRQNSESEFFLCLFQKLYPEVLNKVIGIQLKEIALEKTIENMRMDLYSSLDGDSECIVEAQITMADNSHMEKVIKRIDFIKEGVIVWEAVDFSKRGSLIKKVTDYARNTGKPIDILFVEINHPAVFPLLDDLRAIDPLLVIPRIIGLCAITNLFQLVAEYRHERSEDQGARDEEISTIQGSNPFDSIASSKYYLRYPSMPSRKDSNKYVEREIRKKLWYYPAVYREKTRWDIDLTYGAGDSNTYCIGVGYHSSYVLLRVVPKNVEQYEELKGKRTVLELLIGSCLEFKDECLTIAVTVKRVYRPQIEVLNELVEVFKSFVYCFSDYFYYGDVGVFPKEGVRIRDGKRVI